jgi:phage baseplate assembly protein W
MNIDFPFHFDIRHRTAETPLNDHVRDMLEQLLLTSPGERVNRPDFGSGLLQLVYTPNSPELAAALQFTTQATIQRWLGDLIELNMLEVDCQDSTLTVRIDYTLRSTREQISETVQRRN